MKQSVLKSIMRLFAIVSQVHNVDEIEVARLIVSDYLKSVLRNDKNEQYLIMYEFYHGNFREREIKTGEKQLSSLSVKTVIICEQLNKSLNTKDRILILVNLIEILSTTHNNGIEDIDFIKTISEALNVEDEVFSDLMAFVFQNLLNIRLNKSLLVINSKHQTTRFRYLYRNFLNGNLLIYYIKSADLCIFRHVDNNDQLYYNDREIELNKTYFFENGTVIKSPLLGTLYYSDIFKIFLHEDKEERVIFAGDNISYRFPGLKYGIEPFSFSEESGHFICVMGGSGVGKSTLINLLNGNLKPHTGRILLNGYDVHSESKKLNGLIGFVPQDDILIDELTVFHNLFFNARLSFSDWSKERITEQVNKVLNDLGLYEIRNLKVGNPLNKYISGGQRKRLNIGLELLREPNILFVDEPTSGLSSSDSDLIIDLLKHQSYKGKLVIVNIHQPSSDIFKVFDKLYLMDKGGRIVFQGNPLNALVYLKSYKQLINADEGECPTCGNLNPEQVLQILEAKTVDEKGSFIEERQTSPEEWYENYIKIHDNDSNLAYSIKLDLPISSYNPPGRFKQFTIYSLRNFLSKIADKQYVFINLMEAPLLAFILGWFTRYSIMDDKNSEIYIFNENINLPVFLFIGVVVALFLGLMVSAQEIIKDKNIVKRESFLNLSRFSYFNSKVFYISVLLALQMLLFVFISNYILEIKGMFIKQWIILWITALSSGLLGLNLSATLKSVIAIYVLIPLLLIPQLLLGGAMIHFDNLNSKVTHPEYVPLVGDLMPSRWTYEAVLVNQFTNNYYEKELFGFDMTVSNASYIVNYYIPELYSILNSIKKGMMKQNYKKYLIKEDIDLLISEISRLREQTQGCENLSSNLDSDNFNLTALSSIDKYLSCCRDYYNGILDETIKNRDNKLYSLEAEVKGREFLMKLKNENFNESLANIVQNKNEGRKIVIKNNKVIRKTDPVFYYPENKYGRAHFYAPAKRLGGVYIETYWFNLGVLTLFLLVFYLTLIFRVFPRIYFLVDKSSYEKLFLSIKFKLKNTIKPIID